MTRANRVPPLLIAALAAAGILTLAACGASATTNSAGSPSPAATTPAASTPAATPSVSCARITSLRASVTSLFGTRVSQQTAGKISADLANIRTQFTALTKQVSGLSAESGAVSGLLKALGADAQDLASHPTAANEATLSSAISSLKALGAPLLAELKTSCPGS
ncbi:MAG TPA: hypothetical protein VMR00_18260 [Streptosporangiaceae bacterium]|jgi:ABC-type transporter Mla subunit MlaD|nr:hypothetical protein [Streptosporangiaceae bacterium]